MGEWLFRTKEEEGERVYGDEGEEGMVKSQRDKRKEVIELPSFEMRGSLNASGALVASTVQIPTDVSSSTISPLSQKPSSVGLAPKIKIKVGIFYQF